MTVALMATISAIPVVGGSITQVLTGIGQQIVQERNQRLFEQLSEHLANIDEGAVRKGYFETPEGFDLLIKAMDASRRTRSDEKRDLIARILAGATSSYTEQGNYTPEEYVNLVASLTAKELGVARTIRTLQQNLSAEELDPENKEETWRQCEEAIKERRGIESSDLPLLLHRLYLLDFSDLRAADGIPQTGSVGLRAVRDSDRVCIHMNTNLDIITRDQLLELRAEIDRRLGSERTIAERRDYRDGWLQNEYRRNKNGLRGPYWYFYRIADGKRERVYIGKTDDPEGELERQQK